ncbi:glycoside hydrolase family 3 protein [bacterium]|nr:glycoside hydrolase family 3 protein [bacterium]
MKDTGQFFVFGFEGYEPPYDFLKFAEAVRPGGFILFSRNIRDLDQLCQLTSRLNELSDHPLIMIDQEGGAKNRINKGIPVFPGNRVLATEWDINKIYEAYYNTSSNLRRLGINTNLAPVVDVVRKQNILWERSFGGDATLVSEYSRIAVRATREGGCLSCAKHFPGLGDLSEPDDPHLNLPTLYTSLDDFENVHFKPFEACIAEGVELIMSSHFRVPSLTTGLATFSTEIVALLREKMDFNGVLITDDLTMGAICNNFNINDTVLNSFKAGHDLLLICRNIQLQEEGFKALERNVHDGNIKESGIIKSKDRLLKLREDFFHGR